MSMSLKGSKTFKTDSYFKKLREKKYLKDLDRYGRMGVDALRSATPFDTGKTADSWNYRITHHSGTSYNSDVVNIEWYNTNVNNGVNVAIILQYGHGTKNGSWVEGIDYINPALKPVFESIANSVWKEVTKV